MLMLLWFPGGTSHGFETPQCVTDVPPPQTWCQPQGLRAPWHPWQEPSQGREELNSSSDPQPARQEIRTFLIAPLPLGGKNMEK